MTTAASAMLPVVNAVEPPSAQLLQDVLYDILAVGVDSDASASTSRAIEVFLHEHARAPKPREAFVAFFREQGLSWRDARSLESAAPALPPLKLVAPAGARTSQSARVRQVAPAEVAHATNDSHALEAGESDAWPMQEPVSAGGVRPVHVVGAALALAVIALGMVLGLGYQQVDALSAQLDEARTQSRAQAEALGALQQRLEQVQSGVSSSGERIERVEKQSALLLESLFPAAPAE